MNPHPATPLRSQPTRDRILHEARRLFAELGFEKTTIRAIAAAADINPSMVMRYYTSKEDLFATAAQIDFRMPDLASLPPGRRGVALVTHILDRWEGPAASGELQALLRAAGTHALAQRRLVELVERQAIPVIQSVLSHDQAQERLGLIILQLAGLVMSRYFLKHASVLALDRDVIIRQVGAVVQRYLTAPSLLPRKP